MELAQLSIDMKEALTTLTDVERRRIVLRYYEGLTLKEISMVEGANIASVRNSIINAETKIKKFFD